MEEIYIRNEMVRATFFQLIEIPATKEYRNEHRAAIRCQDFGSGRWVALCYCKIGSTKLRRASSENEKICLTDTAQEIIL